MEMFSYLMATGISTGALYALVALGLVEAGGVHAGLAEPRLADLDPDRLPRKQLADRAARQHRL